MDQETKKYLRELTNEIVDAQLTTALFRQIDKNKKLEENEIKEMLKTWVGIKSRVHDLRDQQSPDKYDLTALSKWDG
jgi:CRISPR/Cas system-associated endonuclease Cas3-HD